MHAQIHSFQTCPDLGCVRPPGSRGLDFYRKTQVKLNMPLTEFSRSPILTRKTQVKLSIPLLIR